MTDRYLDDARQAATDAWDKDTVRRTAKGAAALGAGAAGGPAVAVAALSAAACSEHRRRHQTSEDGDDE